MTLMSKEQAKALSDQFISPAGYAGMFGLIVGYSADVHFLNTAIEKFTLQTTMQRAYQGAMRLALVLDPRRAQLSPTACPGLIHLPFRSEGKRNFNLLHSKVALLGFKSLASDDHLFRLVVSTGNWTRQTLEDSLDFVWSIDVDLRSDDKQGIADIAAAYHLLSDILTNVDTRIFNPAAGNIHGIVGGRDYYNFHRILTGIKRTQGIKARFFDNRTQALCAQLAPLIKHHSGDKKRNLLLLGSGFYENSEHRGSPKVLSHIHNTLLEQGLLSLGAQKHIVVNPDSCQAVAHSFGSLIKDKWQVYLAYDPLSKQGKQSRSLHGKFIFSAYKQRNRDSCGQAWVYLGSGNLTKPGFTQKASYSGGNLEAGIVFSPKGLTWGGEDNPDSAISNKFPVCLEKEYQVTDLNSLQSGSEFTEQQSQHIALPIAYFVITRTAQQYCVLKPNVPFTSKCKFDKRHRGQYRVKNTERINWYGETPRQLTVSYHNDGMTLSADIPVIDEFGRIAATVLPQLELDDAWQAFSAFPNALSVADDSIDQKGQGGGTASASSSTSSEDKSYLINAMMGLVELIAEKQTQVLEQDWPQWCARLEQTLLQLKQNEAFAYFKELAVNPLSPLWHSPFRPQFAETVENEHGKRYEKTLSRIEKKLELAQLHRIGTGDAI
ncbi:hypothetical protein [Pseudoalteromonas sp. PS5]|uniref:hypothetical protein n=1 Tax=Pseudoalteromonas sp. PS5 TaxID=1437473 RepID=UPI000FFEAC64|nr:hypothetical protein [Pseudoalteromonas sp. PS5]